MNERQSFKNIIIIGYGWITGEVCKHIYSLQDTYGYDIRYIEHEVHAFNTVKSICEEHSIPYKTIEDKAELTDELAKIDMKTLIISASNNYLFPKIILEKENITVINFHNALLPKYPGRNAPSWVIYENETITGITWHYVTSRVDAGNIIIQKQTNIGSDIKAYELSSTLMNLAYEAFTECIEDVINEKVESIEQEVDDNRKMYLSKDIPGDAYFDVNDNWEDIYRLLRATDYAKYDIFPPVSTVINGEEVIILRYKITDRDKLKEGEGFLSYIIDDEKALQIKYKNKI